MWRILLASALLVLAGGSAWYYHHLQQERERLQQEREQMRLAAERQEASEIRAEATVWQGKVARVADADGFAARKENLSDGFARAEALFDERAKRWSDSAQVFSNYVKQAEALVKLDGERQSAVAARARAEGAKSRATEAESEKYALSCWTNAVQSLESGNGEFQSMRFVSASNAFVSAAVRFEACVGAARTERMRRSAAEIRRVAMDRRVQMRDAISDEDGFKARKDELEKVFTGAEEHCAEKAKRWAEAAQGFTNYVKQAETLVKLDGDRRSAAAARDLANKARDNAAQAEAEKHAAAGWTNAVQLLESGNGEFLAMRFASASNTFVTATAQFGKCAEEARRAATIATAYRLFESCKYEELLQGADMKDSTLPDVLYLQGLVLMNGLKGTSDITTALQKFEAAAKVGHALAMAKLGAIYCGGFFVKKDEKRGLELVEKGKREVERFAAEGDVYAQDLLGDLYLGGWGYATNKEVAVQWYRRASEKGHVFGMEDYGYCLVNGRGTETNTVVGLDLLERAYAKGDVVSALLLGLYWKDKDRERAEQWFGRCRQMTLSAAEQGAAIRQFWAGYLYENGWWGETNSMEAVRWYTKAAEQGLAAAQNNLGIMYWNGKEVQQDYWTAVKWLRKAADQGLANAQNLMGRAYNNGWGVEKDLGRALEWYTKAAEKGDMMAQNNLGCMYWAGNGVPQNYWTAVLWIRKAAEQGYAMAQRNLGKAYEEGKGVGKDLGEAVRWYRKAAEQGNPDAAARLKQLGYR